MPRNSRPAPHGRPDDLREFIADLFAAAAGMQALRRAIGKSIGLGSMELAILLALWRLRPRTDVGIKFLAEHLHVAGPHITDEVSRLVRRKYLLKAADPLDKRAVNLRLTGKALALLGAVAPDLDKINAHLFEGVKTRDFRILRSSFQRLILRSASAKDLLKS